jgi:hypothetical protein
MRTRSGVIDSDAAVLDLWDTRPDHLVGLETVKIVKALPKLGIMESN